MSLAPSFFLSLSWMASAMSRVAVVCNCLARSWSSFLSAAGTMKLTMAFPSFPSLFSSMENNPSFTGPFLPFSRPA